MATASLFPPFTISSGNCKPYVPFGRTTNWLSPLCTVHLITGSDRSRNIVNKHLDEIEESSNNGMKVQTQFGKVKGVTTFPAGETQGLGFGAPCAFVSRRLDASSYISLN